MSCAVGVDIVQISTCDSCSKCEKELTQSHVGLQVIYFSHYIALTAAVILAPVELMLIAGAVKVCPHQHFNLDSIILKH